MKGLMLHCGASAVSLPELHKLPTPQPKGPRHFIRPFAEDVEIVREDVQTRLDMNIVDEAYGVLNDKDNMPARFFGIIQIQSRSHDFALMIGLRGSYDQSLSRSLAVGSRVFVCDNLAFSGEIQVGTKQTLNIAARIPQMLHRAVDCIPGMVDTQDRRFEAYRNTTITKRDGDAAIIELVRRNALNPSQVGRVVQEWDEPSHAEHGDGGFTLWRLHNAVTEAIKPTNAERAAVPVAWERTRPLTGLLDNMTGVAA